MAAFILESYRGHTCRINLAAIDERREEPWKEQDTLIGGLDGEHRSVLELPGADDVAWNGHAERSALSTDADAEPSAETGAFRRSNPASKIVRDGVLCGTESVLVVAKRRVAS
jgi:hypothetical protein